MKARTSSPLAPTREYREAVRERALWIMYAWCYSPLEWEHPWKVVGQKFQSIGDHWDVAEQTWAMWKRLA